MKIQIVDDDADFAEGLADILATEGHETVLAASGEEAIRQKEQQMFDLTLMDIRMPGMNGIDTFQRFKGIDPDSNVVMMTAYATEDLIDEAAATYAPTVLSKPLDINELLAIVDRFVSGVVLLLVEGDRTFVNELTAMLKSQGHATESALSGAQTIKTIDSTGSRAIVIDLRSTSGLTLDTFKQIEGIGGKLPALVVAAFLEAEAEAMDAFHDLQSRAVMIKPPNTEQLLSIIHRLANKD